MERQRFFGEILFGKTHTIKDRGVSGRDFPRFKKFFPLVQRIPKRHDQHRIMPHRRIDIAIAPLVAEDEYKGFGNQPIKVFLRHANSKSGEYIIIPVEKVLEGIVLKGIHHIR